jgi:hypothetical protein
MLRIIERYEVDGRRVECGFDDIPDDAERPDAPRLTLVEHASAIAVLTGKIAAVVVATWLLPGAAVAILWLPHGGSDPCVGIDTMRLQRCSAAGQ